VWFLRDEATAGRRYDLAVLDAPTVSARGGVQGIEVQRDHRALIDATLAVLAPVGKVLAGSVSRIADFGAFVRIAAGIEGLLHVSELPKRNEHPSKSLEVGQAMMVVVKSADAATRKVSLALAPDGAQVGGIAQRLVGFAIAIVGYLPGGLAASVVLTSMLFATISGSSAATVPLAPPCFTWTVNFFSVLPPSRFSVAE
jgi:hypothetical protein